MQLHKRGKDGDTLLDRPRELRVRRKLSNGQLLSIYFKRSKAKGGVGQGIVYVWLVGVHIGNGRKEANKWYHSGTHPMQTPSQLTGKCGLEGLVQAGKYIREFGYTLMGRRSEMQIAWADEKRMRAYKFLLRYEGFTLYEDDNENPQCIAFRNPDYYE